MLIFIFKTKEPMLNDKSLAIFSIASIKVAQQLINKYQDDDRFISVRFIYIRKHFTMNSVMTELEGKMVGPDE